MSIRVCVPGVSGKMGIEIAKLVLSDNTNIRLTSGVVRDLSKVNHNLSYLSKDLIFSDLNHAISNCDVCVDFTRPEYTMEILNECLKLKN